MLKDDIVEATKRTMASTFDSQGGSGGKRKGKRSQQSREAEQKRSDGVSVHTLGHRPLDAPNSDIDNE